MDLDEKQVVNDSMSVKKMLTYRFELFKKGPQQFGDLRGGRRRVPNNLRQNMGIKSSIRFLFSDSKLVYRGDDQ